MTAMNRLKTSVSRRRRLIGGGSGSRDSVVAEDVTETADRVDQPALTISLKLAAQVTDVYVHNVGAAFVLGPYLGLDVEALEHPAGVTGEQFEQLELLGRQLDAPAAAEHLASVQVHHEVGNPHFAGDDRADAAQMGTHPCEQFLDGERLDQVIISPGIEPDDLVVNAVLGGQDDDRRVGGLADAARDLKSVQYGQHQVENHQVGIDFAVLRKAGDSVIGDDGVVVLGLQFKIDELGDLLLVFDDEDQWFAFHD